jgi:hypothetical protein
MNFDSELVVSHILALNSGKLAESAAFLERVMDSSEALNVAERLLGTHNEPQVVFFALSTVERCARRRWHQLARLDCVRLRDGIAAYAVASNNVDDVVTRKAVQVHVAIGKAEWPHSNAVFLTDIGALANADATARLGLYWLAVAAEDLVAPADTTVSAARQRELRRLLEAETPGIVAFLADRLGHPELSLLVLEALARFIALLPLQMIPLEAIRDRLFALVLKGVSGAPAEQPLAMKAVACVIEIVSRAFVPAEAERAFVEQFQSVCHVLQAAVDAAAHADPSFLAQLVHVVHLLATVHFARLERLAAHMVLPFLELLSRFSAAQATPELFIQCVDVWFALIDHCATHQTQLTSRGQRPAADEYLATYHASILGFAQPLIERVQFACFAADLEALREVDELDPFVVRCIELLVQMAHLYPNEVVTAAHGWCMAQTAALLQAGAVNGVSAVTLRDGATSLRLLGALADLFEASETTEVVPGRVELARSALERAFAVSRACSVPDASAEVLRLHAQALAFFDAFTQWLATYSLPDVNQALLDLAFPAIGVPDETVSELAAKLIRSLAQKVCRDGFHDYPPMRALINQVASAPSSFAEGVRRQLAVAAGSALLNNDTAGYAQFVGAVVSPMTDDAVVLGTDLVRAVAGASHAQRRAAMSAFVPMLEICFARFGSLLHDAARLCALIELVAVAFESLHSELTEAFTQAAAQAFLQLFDDPAALASVVTSSNEDATRLLCRYLSFMAHLAAEPLAAKTGLAAELIAFASERLWPVVHSAGPVAVDVAVELLSALFKVTLAHYKSLQRDAENQEQSSLGAALRVMTAALTDSSELAIVSAAVENLRSLHDKVKALDRSPLRGTIAVGVLSLLAGHAHDVIREHLLELLYAIVSHDLASFAAHMAPAVLIQRQLNGADASAALEALCSQLGADQPTFVEAVTQFADAVHRIELSAVKF